MKLYLTATSERGKPVTKSGNGRIEMHLTLDRAKLATITVLPSGNIIVEKDGEDCDVIVN